MLFVKRCNCLNLRTVVAQLFLRVLKLSYSVPGRTTTEQTYTISDLR